MSPLRVVVVVVVVVVACVARAGGTTTGGDADVTLSAWMIGIAGADAAGRGVRGHAAMLALDGLLLSPTLAGDGAGVLPLPRATLAAMLAHVAAGYPDEACGALAGANGRVVRHFPAANASDTPRTFSHIGARQLVAIWREIDENGWDMLAYYHSHPETPAYPSPRDVRWSQHWPGTFTIIFSFAGRARPQVRAFLIRGESVAEYRVTING